MSLKDAINRLLAPLGVRMVNVRWGPRGEWAPLTRLAGLGFNPSQIVDAGAFRGAWTRHCLQIFPRSRYLMIDPLPENAQFLQRLCSEHANCRFVHAGVSDAIGELTLFSDGMRSSFLKSDVFDQSKTVTVPVRTLDSFLDTPDLNPPQFIKADVQGYELRVLRGGRRCLETTEVILLEVSFREAYVGNPLAHDVIAQLAEWGFAVFDICTYHVDARNGDLLQSDILFCRRGSPWLHYDGGTPMSPDAR
ncbi:MAG: FkbM family methyltransferase [Phycisphaerales bacterium]|nr:FkbM family methyltransferase [Phycisphaerales bacterium]